jgi:hypothetical protein
MIDMTARPPFTRRRLRIANEFRQALHRFRAQRRGIARDARLAGLSDSRHSPVQRSNQFLEHRLEFIGAHRHRAPPLDAALRAAFQISPHPLHRQYAFSSGLRVVVAIAAD